MALVYNARTVRQICQQAALRGRQTGWCQHEWIKEGGEMCLVALLNTALGRKPKDELPMGIRQRLHDHLLETQPSYVAHVNALIRDDQSGLKPSNRTFYTWNDDDERTAAEVLGALEGVGQEHDRWDEALAALVRSTEHNVEEFKELAAA